MDSLERRAKTIVLAFFKVVAINQIFPQIRYKINELTYLTK